MTVPNYLIGVWDELLLLLADENSGSASDRFGETVAIDGDAALIAAIEEDPPGGSVHDGGAVYRFQSLPSCP